MFLQQEHGGEFVEAQQMCEDTEVTGTVNFNYSKKLLEEAIKNSICAQNLFHQSTAFSETVLFLRCSQTCFDIAGSEICAVVVCFTATIR